MGCLLEKTEEAVLVTEVKQTQTDPVSFMEHDLKSTRETYHDEEILQEFQPLRVRTYQVEQWKHELCTQESDGDEQSSDEQDT